MTEQTPARVPRVPVLGLALLTMTVVLAGGAYQLYLRGQPGTPQMANVLRAGVAAIPRSHIAVLVPEGVQTSTVVRYHLGPNETAGRTGELTATVQAPHDDLYAGLLLGGDAVAGQIAVQHEYEDDTQIVRKIDTKLTIGVPSLDSIYDQQLVFFHLTPRTLRRQPDGTYRGSIGFRFTMRAAAIARENARIAVATPNLIRQRTCRLLDGATAERRIAAADLRTLEDMGCVEAEGQDASIQYVHLELPALSVRIDYLYPQPAEPGRLVWRTNKNITVQANLALIDEEARGQRLLFFSGIAAGLASGLAPWTLEVLVSHVRARRRQR